MNIVFIANIVALMGSIAMVISGILKNKKQILIVQTIQIGILTVSNLMLGGITGAIVNIISLFRNILCYNDKLTKKTIAILLVLIVSLSLYFNNLGLIGLLPVISTVIYLLFMNVKDVIKFKYLIIATVFLWLVYDLFIKSYTSAIFDFMTIVSNIISIIQLVIKNKSIKNENK